MKPFRTALTLALVLPWICVTPAVSQVRDRDDPEEGTPSGAIYEIPLEAARRDARPDRGVRASDRAAVHSENGLGSSSVVPGTDAGGGAGGSGSPAGAGGDAAPRSDAGSRPQRAGEGGGASPEAGGGGSSARDGGGAAAEPAAALPAVRTGLGSSGSSTVEPLLLLLVAVLVGGGLAAVAARALRSR